MRSRRRTVLSQVLFSYVFITLSFALVAGYSVWGQRSSVRETELMRSGYLPLALALRDAVAVQNTYNTQLNHVTDVRNPADKRVWFDTTVTIGRPKVFAEIRAALTRAFASQATGLRDDLSQELGHIERYLKDDREKLSALFNALKLGERDAAEQARDELVRRGTRAAAMLRGLESRVSLQVDALIDEASARERRTLRVLLIWALFTVLLGVAVALYARRLLRPLAHVTQRAKAVAGGDFTPRPVTASNDEIGDLSRTFEAMVTEIARVNRDLVESERLATIGKMAAQVTHEVRNPLSSIALNLELLEEELGTADEARTLYLAIRREVERLTELTEQYLSVARRREPRFSLENLNEVVSEAVELMKPELTRHNVTLVTQWDEGVPKFLFDESQIRQVIQNLVRNARQAMPEGGALTVTTACKPAPDTGDASTDAVDPFVDICVADTGLGMAPETRARLFEPFFTTRSHGTGLGLAISRHIIDTHRGSIRCEPAAPRGTRFIVSLPIATDVESLRRRLPSLFES